MIRVLLMIAVSGFVVSVASISAAVALGGPDFVAKGGWKLAGNHWDWDDDDDHDWSDRADRWGKTATRTIAWSGDDRLDLDLAADVRYVQAAGPATVTITGPERLIDHVTIVGDKIKYQDRGHRTHRDRLTIEVRAPNVVSFDISGNNSLTIEGYRQSRLSIDLAGNAEATVSGETEDLKLDLSGSSEANLGSLKTRGADVEASGSSDVTLAPTEWARLEVSGRSDVRLLTRPEKLEQEITGSGRVRQEETSPSPSPSPTPSPSPSPSPKGAKT